MFSSWRVILDVIVVGFSSPSTGYAPRSHMRFAYQDRTCVYQVTLPFVHHSRHGHQVHLSPLLLLAYAHVPHTCVRSFCPSLRSQHRPVVRDFTSWCLPGNRVITRSRFPNAVRVPCIHKYVTFSRHARLPAKSQRTFENGWNIIFYEFVPTSRAEDGMASNELRVTPLPLHV